MIKLIYHGQSVGAICKRIATVSNEQIKAVNDREIPLWIDGVTVRWDSLWRGQSDIEINTQESVALARNKSASRRALEGLCPTTWFNKWDVELPCIVRPRKHFGGRKFFVCNSWPEFKRARLTCKRGWYASELVNKLREFRVFVFQGEILAISEKLPREISHQVAWNLTLGGGSRTLRRATWKDQVWSQPLICAAREAIKRLRLDFGAVDIGWGTGQGSSLPRAFVFEVNTAPGLAKEYTIKKVAEAFWKVGIKLEDQRLKRSRAND